MFPRWAVVVLSLEQMWASLCSELLGWPQLPWSWACMCEVSREGVWVCPMRVLDHPGIFPRAFTAGGPHPETSFSSSGLLAIRPPEAPPSNSPQSWASEDLAGSMWP